MRSVVDEQLYDAAVIEIHPSAWLIVPTLALLLGQALATLPGTIPAEAAVLLLPLLLLIFSRRWRGWGILLVLSSIALSVGFVRHRQLLFPVFAENHVRTVMARDGSLHLEGLLNQEPERLVQRTRWQLRAERIWHPTGAEEITGN